MIVRIRKKHIKDLEKLEKYFNCDFHQLLDIMILFTKFMIKVASEYNLRRDPRHVIAFLKQKIPELSLDMKIKKWKENTALEFGLFEDNPIIEITAKALAEYLTKKDITAKEAIEKAIKKVYNRKNL